MTDEQIKQNAESYANEHMVRTDGGGWEETYDDKEQEAAYIAGAHSRDREVMDLEHLLKAERTTNKVLAESNEKLRNPWISINVKLPEAKKRVLFLCNNGKAYFGYNNIDNGSATITNAPDGVKVTHWMPIPQIEKGE